MFAPQYLVHSVPVIEKRLTYIQVCTESTVLASDSAQSTDILGTQN